MIIAEFTNEIIDVTSENLYQWDVNQTLKIVGVDFNGTASIHFANKKLNKALVVQAQLLEDYSVLVNIPNELLQDKYDILAYFYVTNGASSQTLRSVTIPIIERAKPVDYFQPSYEEINEIAEIELEAKLILNGLYASDYNPNIPYKRPNIVYYGNATYMCNSNVALSGVTPDSDDTRWKLLCAGSYITNVVKNEAGKLQFIFDNGATFEIQMDVEEISTVDTIVADKLNTSSLAIVDNSCDITKAGLYACGVQNGSGNYSPIINIALNMDIFIEGILNVPFAYSFQFDGGYPGGDGAIGVPATFTPSVHQLIYNHSTRKLTVSEGSTLVSCKLITEY